MVGTLSAELRQLSAIIGRGRHSDGIYATLAQAEGRVFTCHFIMTARYAVSGYPNAVGITGWHFRWQQMNPICWRLNWLTLWRLGLLVRCWMRYQS